MQSESGKSGRHGRWSLLGNARIPLCLIAPSVSRACKATAGGA